MKIRPLGAELPSADRQTSRSW